MDPYNIILHPFVTEKTMNLMEKNNALEFVVRRNASKQTIKKAVEELFEVKLANVNTKISDANLDDRNSPRPVPAGNKGIVQHTN